MIHDVIFLLQALASKNCESVAGMLPRWTANDDNFDDISDEIEKALVDRYTPGKFECTEMCVCYFSTYYKAVRVGAGG
jgi:hypothetical protein